MPEESGQDQEKTEEPTQHRLDQARERGQIPFSKEISSVSIFVAFIMLFLIFRGFLISQFSEVWAYYFTYPGDFVEISNENITAYAFVFIKQLAMLFAPIILIVLFFGIFGNLAQVGIVYAPKKLTPDISKINPLKGLQKIFSKDSIVEFLKAVSKILIIAGIAYVTIKGEIKNIPRLIEYDARNILEFIIKAGLKLGMRVSFLMVFLAGFDFGYQRWSTRKKLMMTRQELKEEMKEREGDPLLKQRIRQVQHEMSRQRMMQEIPEATAVVTNPTHLAVALKYKRLEMQAPQCVAKGGGVVAEKIKEIARKHNVPVIENKPLARELYKKVKIGEYIPSQLYKAVAEFLTYVFKLKAGKKKKKKLNMNDFN